MADKLTSHDRAAYQQMYDSCDADHDGKIEFGEFDELIKCVGEEYPGDTLRDIFEKADKDGDNRIDFNEFVRICPRLPPVAEYFMKEFKKIDTDGNGVLSKEELRFAILTNIHGKWITPSKVQDMIDKVDVNKDGKISYNEFLDMIPDLYKD